MEIKFRISELDYGTAAVSLLPVLCGKLAGQDGVKGKLCELLCQIPPQQLGGLINAVQPSTINQLLAMVLDSRKAGLLTMADSALRDKGLPVSLRDISLSSELELNVNADVDDYGELFSKLLISEDTGSLKSAVFGGTGKLLSSIPRSMLDSFAVTLLNKNQALIAAKLTTAAHEHGLELKIDQMSFSP